MAESIARTAVSQGRRDGRHELGSYNFYRRYYFWHYELNCPMVSGKGMLMLSSAISVFLLFSNATDRHYDVSKLQTPTKITHIVDVSRLVNIDPKGPLNTEQFLSAMAEVNLTLFMAWPGDATMLQWHEPQQMFTVRYDTNPRVLLINPKAGFLHTPVRSLLGMGVDHLSVCQMLNMLNGKLNNK